MLGLVLAGCAQAGEPADQQAPEQAASEQTAADTGDGTRVVLDATGEEVEVPADPQRIVALGEVELDSLLALDIEPVGTTQGRGQQGPPSYLGEEAEGIELVGELAQPNLEAIAALEPDLILASYVHAPPIADESALENLREITPATVVASSVDETWKDSLARIGEAVNDPEGADRVLSDYEQSVEEARAAFGEHVGDTASIVRWDPEGPIVMSPEVFAGLVLGDLGLEVMAAPRQQSGHPHSPPLSLEELDQIDGDWMFVGALGGEEQNRLARETIQSEPLWQRLNVVQNDHVVFVDGSLWTSVAGPLGAQQVVQTTVEGITGATGT
jgi:iron complex transport system substrate-binding protein